LRGPALRGIDLRAAVSVSYGIPSVAGRKRVLGEGGIVSEVLGFDGNKFALIRGSENIPTGRRPPIESHNGDANKAGNYRVLQDQLNLRILI